MFGHTANKITGGINKQYNKVQYYFKLKQTNDSLLAANEALYNKLRSNYDLPDSTTRIFVDTMRIDSVVRYRKFEYLGAKVVANGVADKNNYIILAGDNVPTFTKQAAVVDANNGVIGVVTEVSGRYATVMSLLHSDSKISAQLYRTSDVGTITWDGKQPNLLTLSNIPKGTDIHKGDSVITSGFSTIFPKALMVGRVEAVYKEKSTSSLRIMVRSSANFNSLQYGYVILNNQKAAIDSMLQKRLK